MLVAGLYCMSSDFFSDILGADKPNQPYMLQSAQLGGDSRLIDPISEHGNLITRVHMER